MAVVLVTLSMACASADTCQNNTLNNYLGAGYSCTIGDKVFSNFFVLFSGFHGDNAPAPILPANSDVYVQPMTSGNSYGFLFTYMANDYVMYNQGLNLDIDYLVTVTDARYAINSVFTQVTGGTQAPGGAVSGTKNLCLGGAFDNSGGFASNTCPTGFGNSPGTAFVLGSSSNPATNDLYGTRSIANTTILGVSDYVVLTGGSTTLTGKTAQINQMQNMFNQVLIQTGVPEPATFLLLGSALLGLGVLRRKRV